MQRPLVVAFDVFETVVSLEPLRPRLVALGLTGESLETLYAMGLRDAFALTVMDGFAPWRDVLDGALDQLLTRLGLASSPEARADLLDGLTDLPPQPDAGQAFALLAEAGVRIVAASNGAAAGTRRLLEAGGLMAHVERVLSVDEVGRFKPHRRVYEAVAAVTGVAPHQAMLVAAHPWDTAGAASVGLATLFVSRGMAYPAALQPADLTAVSLADAARRIVSLDPPR